MRRGRWLVGAVAATAAVTVAVLLVVHALDHPLPQPDACTVGSGPSSLLLTPDQAQNASTIAAVAGREELPRTAVTVALATALRESKLRNLPYGDRDSLGLFQQRPSQGWGRPRQLLSPAYAAAAFYTHLRQVPHWRRLPVAAAAQEVQHSVDGAAYALWEEEARALTSVLTGRKFALLTCGWARPVAVRPTALLAAASRELGPAGVSPATGDDRATWTTATWLECHGYAYGVDSVSVRGLRWTPSQRSWRADATATGVAYTLARAPGPG